MQERKLYLQSDEFDFLKNPITIRSYKIKKNYLRKQMIAELEVPINIWFKEKLYSYSTVILKPRYLFESFSVLGRKSLTVNVAGFNLQSSKLDIIGYGELYLK